VLIIEITPRPDGYVNMGKSSLYGSLDTMMAKGGFYFAFLGFAVAWFVQLGASRVSCGPPTSKRQMGS